MGPTHFRNTFPCLVSPTNLNPPVPGKGIFSHYPEPRDTSKSAGSQGTTSWLICLGSPGSFSNSTDFNCGIAINSVRKAARKAARSCSTACISVGHAKRWFNQMLVRWTKNDENLKANCYLLIFAFVQTKILLLAHDYAFNCPPQMKSQSSSL